MTALKIFGKWTILIWLNVIFSFFIAVSEGFDSIPEVLGITLGVFTFVGIYSVIDFYLLQRGKDSLRKFLLIGVIIKAFTQLFPWLQLFSGLLSLHCVQRIMAILGQLFEVESVGQAAFSKVDSFFIPYFATLVNGVILSILVGLLVIFIKLIATVLIPLFKQPPRNRLITAASSQSD